MSILEITSQFLFKVFMILQCYYTYLLCQFLVHFFILALLWLKGSHQSPKFDTFKCSDENSSCYFRNHKSVFLQISDDSSVSRKITPLDFFKSNVIYFAQKRPIKVQNFETCEWSYQNSPSSCYFWNNKLVFLQISHYSSVSWDITPPSFFRWNFINFQKDKNWWNFTWTVESLKFCTLIGSFCPNNWKFQL